MSKFKVGDRVRRTGEDWHKLKRGDVATVTDSSGGGIYVDGGDYCYDEDLFDLVPSFHPNNTVRLKSGEPFTTGSYTALVDSVTEDKVILKHGSWLPVEAVEKVEAWLPEGDGWIEYSGGGTNPVPGAEVEWLLDWERRKREFTHATRQSDLLAWSEAIVAYRIVEPAPVPAAEPAAQTKPKFKVGDRVRYTGADPDVHDTSRVGATGLVTDVRGKDVIDVTWDDGHPYPRGPLLRNLELIEPAATSVVNLTISVDTSPLQADLADQFQRIADALRAA